MWKKITILILITIFLSGCSNEHTCYPEEIKECVKEGELVCEERIETEECKGKRCLYTVNCEEPCLEYKTSTIYNCY